MAEIKKTSLTKKDISKKINLKTGLSNLYAKQITNDFINILKSLIRNKEINIKNFGSFKIVRKNERIGRNPKSSETYLIKGRKSLSFKISKNLNNKINNI